MLEDPSDRMGGSTVTISGAEFAEWENLCFKFNLQEFMKSFARRVESLQFCRSSRQVGDANLSRIDKFHADQFFWELRGSLGIMLGTNFVDHGACYIPCRKIGGQGVKHTQRCGTLRDN